MSSEILRTPQGPLITVVPEAKLITVTSYGDDGLDIRFKTITETEETGRELAALSIINSKPDEPVHIDALAQPYMDLVNSVPGKNQTRYTPNRANTRLRQLAQGFSKLLPEIITFNYETSIIRLGQYAVASRKATEAELPNKSTTGYITEIQPPNQEEEENKIDLFEYNHAIIKVGDSTYYLPLTSKESMLAARLIETIQYNAGKGKHVETTTLASLCWRSMSYAERRLYTTSKDLVTPRIAKYTKPAVERLMSTVIFPIGIGRFNGMAPELKLKTLPEITFSQEEPSEEHNKAVPIFPPGTKKELLRHTELGELAQEQRAFIRDMLDTGIYASKLSHDVAVSLLDILMDKPCKVMAGAILESEHNADPDEVFEALHTRIKGSLNDVAYNTAVRHRTIAGNVGTGKIQQVSGRLPGRTLNHINSPYGTTTKWHIGKQD